MLTWAGGMLVLSPIPTLISLSIGAAAGGLSRRFAWAALVSAFAFPVVQAIFEPRAYVVATGALMTFIGLRFFTGILMNSGVLSKFGRGEQLPA